MQAPPGPFGCACVRVHMCLSEREQKGAACFLVTWWPRKHGRVTEASRMQMLAVCKMGCRKKRRKQMKRRGDNKLSANQATKSGIALLDWMQQAYVFQPDYWSMWTHIFPSMGEKLSRQSQCLSPPLLLSLPAPRLRVCLILSSFLSCLCLLCVWLFHSLAPSLCATHGDIIFPLSKTLRKASRRCAVKACCQNLGTISAVQGDPNWKLWRYNKQTENVWTRKWTDAMWYATISTSHTIIVCLGYFFYPAKILLFTFVAFVYPPWDPTHSKLSFKVSVSCGAYVDCGGCNNPAFKAFKID